jgi:hypothetical protein
MNLIGLISIPALGAALASGSFSGGRDTRWGRLCRGLKRQRLFGDKLETVFGGSLAEQSMLTFFVLLFVLAQTPFGILQSVTQHSVVKSCQFVGQSLGGHQPSLATADAPIESSQAFIHALDQAQTS